MREPWVIRGVSADLPPGRLVRVSGRNGAGKSTLLRVVAGVSAPSAGKVTGRPHAGYVPERFPGGLPFTGREYLLQMARVHGLGGTAGRRRAEEWLDRLGAAGYAGQSLRSMSKGMCQKMAIAQALLPSPGLLVLDEAWTGLDQAARAELDDAVSARFRAGGTVLFVDHDQARLAGREDERWDVDGASGVTVLAGPAPVAAPVISRVTIRLEATDAADVIGRVRAIDGARVLSVDIAAGTVDIAAGTSADTSAGLSVDGEGDG
jgi:ABC-type Mn2+/Zn2+ transport system ATPase subunit